MNRAAIAVLLALPLGLSAAEPGERWIRIDTPEFELFTSAPEREGRDLLARFEQIRAFFLKASPVPLLEQFPVRIIAFGAKEQFRPYSPIAQNVAYATSSRRTDYIVMQDAEPTSYRFAVHEYMHLLVKHSGLRLPVWLNEGWAEVYSTMRPVRGGVAVGDLAPERVRDLGSAPLLDFNTLTSVTEQSQRYTTGIFYAESWALVHMLFLSPEYAENFPKFLVAIHRGASAEEACSEAWGKAPEQVITDLRSYLDRKKLYGRVFEAPLGKAEGGAVVTKIDEFESRLMLADLRATIGQRRDAQADYDDLAAMRPGDPRLDESLGYFLWSVKDMAGAREHFEKAFAAGDADARMCFELSLLERDAHQTEKSIAALERAVRSEPRYGDALLQLGLMRVATRQYQTAIESLTSIHKVTPVQATPLFSALAYAYFETGNLEKARDAALTAKRWALLQKEASGVDSLLAIIDARAKSPFAPRPGEKVVRAEGTLQEIDCSGGSNQLTILAGQGKMVFDMPDAQAIEFVNPAGNPAIKLTCGPQKPTWVAVEYAPASVMREGPAGVVRRLEFR
jgi:tetratricopeptide (TPR) repeat protein